MFARLVQIFGQGFVTRNGEEPNRDWIDLFSRMTDQQLDRGVKNARERKQWAFSEGKQFFPPDADEFEVLCKKRRQDEPKALPMETSEEEKQRQFEAHWKRLGYEIVNGLPVKPKGESR